MDADGFVLPGALRSLKQAIEARLAGNVVCKDLPIGNTVVLEIDDHETIKHSMIAVVEMNSADEYFIAVPLTVPLFGKPPVCRLGSPRKRSFRGVDFMDG